MMVQDCACGAEIGIAEVSQEEARGILVHHTQTPRHREWSYRAYPPSPCKCGTCARSGVGCLVVTPRTTCYGCRNHAQTGIVNSAYMRSDSQVLVL